MAYVWLGASVCEECSENIVANAHQHMLFIPEKFRIVKTGEVKDNAVWSLFMRLGGNTKMQSYMTEHGIGELRLEDDLIIQYQEGHLRDVMQFENLRSLPYTIANISEVLLPIFGILS